MDANDRQSKVRAAKAVMEQNIVKKQMDHAERVFSEAETIEQVLGYLAGAASVCWTEKPKGTFRSEMASDLVEVASRKVHELVQSSLKRFINEQIEAQDGLLDYDPDECPIKDASVSYSISGEDDELAGRMRREADHG